jgi:YD repeat-containing protein
MNEMLTAGNASYIYDANGNTVSQTVGGQTTTYQYNFDNKLTQINFPGGGGSNTFVYNGEGVRVQKADSGGTVKFVYDGANVIGELDNANALVTAYTHGVGGLVSLRRAAGPSYYHFDGLGSTRELTAAAQNVTDTYDYEAYGIPTGQTGSTVNPYRYV